ncbi:c2h2 finger domain containing protein [Niveomyces insectorum RCEF 264]|uniref:C2h2 finger domain containing protein n=1 Tax=Niveomyces insectorum RCEF 264 TaxID=1081102 RepID=A0A167VH26_9HYPO|nr:c2h2 finger domain containing protein [Niveomyces insectorum RCEF 264]
MSSFPFPDLPFESADRVDEHNNQQRSTPTDASLPFSPPPLNAASMLHHISSSPSLRNVDTPAESVALSIHYQSSDFSEFDVDNGDDNYFNAIFDATGGNAPSFLDQDPATVFDPFGASTSLATTAAAHTAAHLTYATPEPLFNGAKTYPISPDQTPALNAFSSLGNAAFAAAQNYTTSSNPAVGAFDGLIAPEQLTKIPPTTASLPQLQAFVVNDVATQLTPDTTSSGGGSLGTNDRGSLSTEEGLATATTLPMANQPAQPHVTVSLWGKDSAAAPAAVYEESGSLAANNVKTERLDGSAAEFFMPSQSAVAAASHEAQDGASEPERSSPRTRQGIDPSNRSTTEVPASVNEDAENRKIQTQNVVISQWLDTAEGDDSEISSFTSTQQLDLAFEGVSDRDIDLGGDTQNVQQPGRTYYTGNGGPLTATDYEIMLKGSIWENSPAVLRVSQGPTRHQPQSSQAAIEKFERMYHDNASIVSRAATWGTRRRSLPSIADYEGITSGNFLKKLTINRNETARRPSIFGNLRTLVRKPSTSAQLKRSRGVPDDETSSVSEERAGEGSPEEGRRDSTKSSNTLHLPSRSQSWGKSKQPMPSINTALISMGSNMASIGATHARSGSVSKPQAANNPVSLSPPLTSPKSPLLKVGNSLRRPRSKSDTKAMMDSAHPNLVRMLKKTGGPPVASLATANATAAYPGPTSAPTASVTSAPAPAPIKIPAAKAVAAAPDGDEEEEEEEDGLLDDGDLKAESDDLINKISPDFNGFKELVLGLNPMLAHTNTYLVDRLAHQQVVRYKGLLNARIKHLGYVKGKVCPSGALCIGQGGASVVLDSQGEPRNLNPLSASYDGADDDEVSSPLEGAINADSFPQYIPMPPTTTLPADFECQLCFQTKRPQKPSDWTKHVHEDVQPFTCTWDRCRDPKIFKRKADWVRHENEGHRHLEWWTCDVDECRHTCYRRDNFLQHLVREHKFSEPKHKTKAAIKRAGATDETWERVEQCHAETTVRPQEEPCRFCGKTFPSWKKLTVHLAKHMEHISLPILRLVERKEVEEDTIISPVQDPPPRTFAPSTAFPATAEAHHGRMGSGVPPNMMAAVQGPTTGTQPQQNQHQHNHHHLSYPMGYAPPPPDSSGYLYANVTQMPYAPTYYSQQPYGAATGLPSHMQSLDTAAAMDATSLGPGYSTAGAYAHSALPVTTGGYLGGPEASPYMTDASSLDPSTYTALSAAANALGLQAPLAGGQLPYDAVLDPSIGNGEQHYTPHGSVSPFRQSPHQPQSQFYGQ